MATDSYPRDPTQWSEGTVKRLVEEARQEDTHLEFKSRFRNSRWQGERGKDIRKRAMAFANHDGGISCSEYWTTMTIPPSASEISKRFLTVRTPDGRSLTSFKKIEPQIEYSVNSFNTDSIGVVVVSAEKAIRPPVNTPGECTYYRHTENSLPLTPD